MIMLQLKLQHKLLAAYKTIHVVRIKNWNMYMTISTHLRCVTRWGGARQVLKFEILELNDTEQ